MPTPVSTRVLLERIAVNPKASIRSRLAALERLQKLGCSLSFLNRLLRDPGCPPRVLTAALTMREAKETIRAWKKKQATHPSFLETG